MYGNLTSALIDRFIEEIRGLWSEHPKYPDLSENIQGKFSFKSRPQRGMVIKTTGGSNVRLSPDNFQGTVMSYVSMAAVPNKPSLSLEWVKEDSIAISKNNNVMPTPPGVYYITITKSNINQIGATYGMHEYVITPNYEIIDEAVIMEDNLRGFVERPFIEGSIKLVEMPSNYTMVYGVDYTADPETGEIVLTEPLESRMYLSADYYYLGENLGPYKIYPDMACYTALPGIVLAFGRRISQDDMVSVLVSRIREPASLEYGGKWEISIDIEMWARDVDDQREITDAMMIWVPSILRGRLAKYGIDIKDTSFGGESEEPYDNTADDYFYGSSISLTLETDWALHVPISSRIWRLIGVSSILTEVNDISFYSDVKLRLMQDLGLVSFEDPFFVNLGKKIESIA